MTQFLLVGKEWPEKQSFVRPSLQEHFIERQKKVSETEPSVPSEQPAEIESGPASPEPYPDRHPGYPDNNPKTQFGVKKAPLHLVPPSALYALAQAFKVGASKYGPYNWREKQISSSVYYAALLRHVTAWWDGEDNDKETGNSHIWHAMACLAMMVDGKAAGKLNDDRPVGIHEKVPY